jgi:type II secretory pathway predicted ATPase ExeA
MICDDVGLDVKGKDKATLTRELNDFLIEQHAKRRSPILIIDEAQNLKPELLEEIRMLSNLETNHAKLLQIILVGQPELREILAAPELRQLRQRMSVSCRINPLTKDETGKYILRRLEVAGNRDAVTFTDDSIAAVYKYCRGIPRLTNILCDFLMLAAYNEEVKKIDSSMVHDIAEDLDFENHFWGKTDGTDDNHIDRVALLKALQIDQNE